MKKHLIATLAVLLLVPFLHSCRPNSGDGVMERPDYTMVKYDLTFTDEFLAFYDVTVTYMTVDGRKLTETVTSISWAYSEKSEENHSSFYLAANATCKPKDKRPTLGSKVESVTFSCEYSAEYYSKATSAKRIHNKGAYATVKKENIDAYLDEHPSVKICEIDMNSFSE